MAWRAQGGHDAFLEKVAGIAPTSLKGGARVGQLVIAMLDFRTPGGS